ncbi:MAG: ATP phosphoribosyltransferase [Phycisphaerales bacterium]|jgi:ATP phosphoribosyltransferase
MQEAQKNKPATAMKLALPKGRMAQGVNALLDEAGMSVRGTSRDYRPSIGFDGISVKILKPRAIVEMLADGTRDLGFAGTDWVIESGADLVELLDTGLDRVRLVAAAPSAILINGRLPDRPLMIASEYLSLTRDWIKKTGLDATLRRSYGATEVLPPDDADCIVDNTATGSTLEANRLEIIDDLMVSSTRLYASQSAMNDPAKRSMIELFVVLIDSVLEARRRVMVEFNVSADSLEKVIACLPCMREPTVSPLHGSGGFAVKSAVPKARLTAVIPEIRAFGGTDIVVSKPQQIMV